MSPARRSIGGDVGFVVLALSLVALTYTPLAGPFDEVLCAVSFRGAEGVLSVLGVPHAVDAAHRVLSQGAVAVEVNGACSGMRAVAFFAAVMILLDAPRREKLVHFAAGAAVLTGINVLRIAHLFELRVESSPHFAAYHAWIWPAVMGSAILLYRLARRGRAASAHADRAPA